MHQATTIALVTGANKGIGLEVARELGRTAGCTVFIGARDRSAGSKAADALKADGIDARALQLDVTDVGSLAIAGRLIDAQCGRLDVLVNNAGILLDDTTPSQTPLDVVRQTYETNVFGVVAATQRFLPLLRKSATPRIVNVSSGLGSLTLRSDPNHFYHSINGLAYMSSKTCLNAVTVCFAQELVEVGFKVNAADPGYTATDLNNFGGQKTPQQGAAVIVSLATLGADGPTGGFFSDEGAVPW